MKVAEIRALSDEQLNAKLKELKSELFKIFIDLIKKL